MLSLCIDTVVEEVILIVIILFSTDLEVEYLLGSSSTYESGLFLSKRVLKSLAQSTNLEHDQEWNNLLRLGG